MSKKVSFKYEHFEKLWSKANISQRFKMFYYSLFDFGSFEMDARMEIINYTKEVEKNFVKLIRDLNKRIFSKIKKDGFVNAISSDKFLRFILFYELQKRGIKVIFRNNNFPDLLINSEIDLEIKRLTTSRNIQDYFENVNSKNSHKLYLLLFFPRVLDEDLKRLRELTNGYYFIKDNLKGSMYTDMLILYPDVDNFEKILESIIACLNNPKWCKNE